MCSEQSCVSVNPASTSTRLHHTIRRVLIAGLALLACGCGSKSLEVQGTVMLDDQPVESGSISFEPANGQGSEFGAAIVDGAYQATSPASAQPGPHIVRIRGSRKTGRQIAAGPPHPPTFLVDEITPISTVYNEQSNLTIELTPQETKQADFNLKSQAK